jgi:hypothetical protein
MIRAGGRDASRLYDQNKCLEKSLMVKLLISVNSDTITKIIDYMCKVNDFVEVPGYQEIRKSIFSPMLRPVSHMVGDDQGKTSNKITHYNIQ